MIKWWGLVLRAYIEVLGIWFTFLKIPRTVLEVVPTFWKRGLTAETETVCTRYTSVQGWRSGCIVTWRRMGEDGRWLFVDCLFLENILALFIINDGGGRPVRFLLNFCLYKTFESFTKVSHSFISVDYKNKWGTIIAYASLNKPLFGCQ